MRKDVKVWLRIHTIFLQCTMIGCYFWILLPLCTSNHSFAVRQLPNFMHFSCAMTQSCVSYDPASLLAILLLKVFPSTWNFRQELFCQFGYEPHFSGQPTDCTFLENTSVHPLIYMQLVSCLSILKGSAFNYILSITYSYVLCGCPGVMSMEGLAYVHHWVYLLTHTVVKCACATLQEEERKRLLR